jgi:RecB family exonuclease
MAFEAPEADHGIERLILAGVSDLFPAAAQLVQGVTGQGLQVDALVRAPMELAESFDGLGCLDVGAWLERRLDIPDETIHQVDGPVDQARAVVAAVGSLGGAFDVAEISVALANPGLAPFVEDELAGRGVATRYAGGRPAGRTAPYLLLSEVARYVDGQPFEALTSLARHPDLSTASEVLTGLDAYATEHLPSRTPREGQGPGERPGDPSWMVGRRRHVNRAVKRVGQLCGALAEGRPMTLPEVGEAILETLRDAYKATTFDQARREGRARLMALEELQKAAQSCGQLSPALVNAIGARAPGPLLRMLLRHAAERAVPDPENPAAIEMSDWLEVVLDDAPVLIIAGLNEGFVPQSVHGDPILPDRLRAALGITHNDLRMARDAHAMSAMLAERAERGFLAIITGRFDADREPLVPSRLLLRGSRPGDVIARTRRLFAPAGATRGSRHPSLAHVSAGPGLPRIIPQAGETLDGDSLSVTDFKRYLACPYRFWLWRVKGLEVRDDTARELSAAGFGNLIHACLEAFGSDEELRACSDAAVIERALLHHLDHTVELLFGSDARRAVAIQAAVARRRLQAFAHAQAARVAEGWRQVLVEKTFSKTDKLVALPVEGAPFYVHGRIDRVDIHEDGRLAVLDYKTGPSTPDQDHRKGLQNSKRWVNLQLPLYRLMAAALEIPHESVITGYGILPSDPTKSRFLMAEWDAEAFEEADALAVEVATQIRAGVFWPPSPHPPRYTDGLEGLCQEGALNAQSVAAPDGGP